MTPDAHTPCPACRIEIRQLYAIAKTRAEQAPGDVLLQVAVANCAPLIDAHDANQDHAFSPELLDARGPGLLDRAAAELGYHGNGARRIPAGVGGELHRCVECDFVTNDLDVMATHVTRTHKP